MYTEVNMQRGQKTETQTVPDCALWPDGGPTGGGGTHTFLRDIPYFTLHFTPPVSVWRFVCISQKDTYYQSIVHEP